ncbi:hypothetical protein DdX_10470 [Ditylenchus destructor]|uniref:G-protein coupled receptors family 1 profile domain-containing protein n=1 Tax=Ditylenchus destructor TaxID=166010 RepID=A0AAD4R564_9BILA|nr:hypothetical protein DdX_10470 [Ditylenchus destructor]
MSALIVSQHYYANYQVISHNTTEPNDTCLKTSKVCQNDASPSFWSFYQYAELVVSYIFPLILCVAVYGRIWWCFRILNKSLSDTMATIISPSIICGAKAQVEVRQGILKLLILVTSIFFICYGPDSGKDACFARTYLRFDILPAWWMYPRTILLQLAVSINPLIFGRLSSSYRARIRTFKANLGAKLRWMVPKKMRSNVVETIELSNY